MLSLLLSLSLCAHPDPGAGTLGAVSEERGYEIERYWWRPIRTGRGEWFRIVGHFPWDVVLEPALETAEASGPMIAAAYGIELRRPQRPYNLHLFRDRVLFDRACQELTGERWPANNGLTDRTTGVSMVLLGSGHGDEAFLENGGLTLADRRLIAHEATHLLATYQVPGDAYHPPWLSEGIAEYVASGVMLELGLAGSRESDPVGMHSLVYLQTMLSEGNLPSPGTILAGSTPGVTGVHRYGLYENLVQFMIRTHPGRWQHAMKLAMGAQSRDQLGADLAALWWNEDAEDFTADFQAHLASRSPMWWNSDLAAIPEGDAWKLVVPESKAGMLWSGLPWQAKESAWSGQLIIPERRTPQRFYVVFAQDGQRRMRLVLDTESGLALELFDGDRRTELAALREISLPRGEAFEIRIESTEDAAGLRAQVGDLSPLEAKLPPGFMELGGRWGVGQAAGCWAKWSQLGPLNQ